MDEHPMPWIETLTDRTHGRRIVSHIHHDHLQKVRLARRMVEWTAGILRPMPDARHVAA